MSCSEIDTSFSFSCEHEIEKISKKVKQHFIIQKVCQTNLRNNNCVGWLLNPVFPAVTLRDKKQLMKFLFFFCFIILFGWLGGSFKNPPDTSVGNVAMILKDTIDFINQVQPVLVKNCSPCHFIGGKMYSRMPFDKDSTIINHETGILKRFKGDENAVIQTFIGQSKIR